MTNAGTILLVISTVIFTILTWAKVLHLKRSKQLKRTIVFRFIDGTIILISIVAIAISTLWDFNYLNYSEPIEHRNWHQITLADFKGLNRPAHTLYGETDFAFISTSIVVNRKLDAIDVHAVFHPCRSYVFDRSIYSKSLLTHELYHFHITEFCARQMRKIITENHSENREINLGEVRRNFLNLEKKLQSQYDFDTYHSYVKVQQVAWEKKIDNWLDSLSKFQDTRISLKKHRY